MTNPWQTAKLADCRDHGPGSGAELFVVEGDSASRAVESVRDARFQAVLPMQGKPLNALRASRRTVEANPLFGALVEAMCTGAGESFDAGAARYERVVLLTDPDADGIHCGVLLLFYFHRWMRPWLEDGRLEAVQAPMFEIVPATGGPIRAFTEEEYRERLDELARAGTGIESKLRHRGLGSIDPGTLRTCCVSPETRRSFRLRPEDATAAIAVFSPELAGKVDGDRPRSAAEVRPSRGEPDAGQLPLFESPGPGPRRSRG
ncbi:MAG: toprim domain-containing protein [Alphaproteobacteria bacterium]